MQLLCCCGELGLCCACLVTLTRTERVAWFINRVKCAYGSFFWPLNSSRLNIFTGNLDCNPFSVEGIRKSQRFMHTCSEGSSSHADLLYCVVDYIMNSVVIRHYYEFHESIYQQKNNWKNIMRLDWRHVSVAPSITKSQESQELEAKMWSFWTVVCVGSLAFSL